MKNELQKIERSEAPDQAYKAIMRNIEDLINTGILKGEPLHDALFPLVFQASKYDTPESVMASVCKNYENKLRGPWDEISFIPQEKQRYIGQQVATFKEALWKRFATLAITLHVNREASKQPIDKKKKLNNRVRKTKGEVSSAIANTIEGESMN